MSKLKIPREYLGAFKAGHRRNARDFIDDEFSFSLLKEIQQSGCEKAKEALAYIARFNNEYHKDVIKKGDPDNLHNDEQRLEGHRNNYRRSCDIFSNFPLVYLTPDLEKLIPG